MSNTLRCLKLSRIWQNFVLATKFHLFFLHIASILCIATIHVYSKRALHVDTVHALLSTYTTIVTCIIVTCFTVTCASLSAVSRTVYCRHCDCIHLRVIHVGTSVNFVQCTCTLHAIFVIIVTQCAYREYI